MSEIVHVWRESWAIPKLTEVASYVLTPVVVCHALRQWNAFEAQANGEAADQSDRYNRWRWLSTLVWGALFGIFVEWLLSWKNSYIYGNNFLWTVPNPFDPNKPVPVGVGVGWGIILYATTWVAQRLKPPTFPRAVFAGLLALNIDISLDPVARWGGLWHGDAGNPEFYGVPFDNFTGWLVIVTSYSFFVRFLFRKVDTSKNETFKCAMSFLVPAAAAGIATGLTVIIDHLLCHYVYKAISPNYPKDTNEWVVLALLLIIAFVFVRKGMREVRCDRRPSAAIMTVPFFYHGLCLMCGWYLRMRGTPVPLSLIAAVIPLAMFSGIIAFAWGSRDLLARAWFPAK